MFKKIITKSAIIDDRLIRSSNDTAAIAVFASTRRNSTIFLIGVFRNLKKKCVFSIYDLLLTAIVYCMVQVPLFVLSIFFLGLSHWNFWKRF